MALASRAYRQHYAGRIYPGVNVYGVDLSRLTVDKAAAALCRQDAGGPLDPATLPLTLRDGERTWRRSWADAGIRLDPLSTARLGYQVGRGGDVAAQTMAQLRALLVGWPLSPVIVLPHPAQASAALESLAPEVAIPPVDATLIIQSNAGGIALIPVPAQAGLELDTEATVAALPYAVGIGPEGLVMELLTRPVPPAIPDPGPAQAHAETLLSRPFLLVADDPLTGFNRTWTVAPEEVAGWLIVQPMAPAEEAEQAWLLLTVEEAAVRTTLQELARGAGTAPQADGGVFDVEATLPRMRAAVEAGQGQATVALSHLPHTYIVQPGDTLTSVARGHGFPVWRLNEANPGIEPGKLRPGQEIVIPSVDVLFPLPIIADRRIVVDVSDQHLLAYEGDVPVHDFVCSTGIASSPTLTGTFQILSKEEEAYASSWDLWMPHFMGIYRTGPDFTNGIHALPTLSSGARLWEGHLGRPISYGCIVIGLDEAATLYEWAELGTLVLIQE
jgi:LysM repeat protein